MTKAIEKMIRGLVRGVESKEQAEGGRLWDQEAREALAAARGRGWGRDRTGWLDEKPGLLAVGTRVAVRAFFLRVRSAWTIQERAARGAALIYGEREGIIREVHDSHGLCYRVELMNCLTACFDPDELEALP